MSSVAQPVPQSSLSCPECGGRPRETNDYVVCAECGLVLGNRIADTSPLSESTQRILPPTRMGSVISRMKNRSRLTDTKSEKVTRLQRTASSIKTDLRSMGYWSCLLRRIQTRAEFPDNIYLRTLSIFEHSEGGYPRNRSSLLVACLITAAHELNHPFNPKTVYDFLPYRRHPGTLINRALFYLQKFMKMSTSHLVPVFYLPQIISGLRENKRVTDRLVSRGVDPEKYLSKIESEARVLLNSTDLANGTSRSRRVLAASCCYAVDHSATGIRAIRAREFRGIHESTILERSRLWVGTIDLSVKVP